MCGDVIYGPSIYDHLIGEQLCDPEQVSRELDEWLIRWHAARLPTRSVPFAPGASYELTFVKRA